MANDSQSLITDSSCLICEGASLADAMDMQLMRNIIAGGGVVPPTPCTIPLPPLSFRVSALTSTTITFSFAAPIPAPTVGYIVKWGTTLGGPYPNSKSFAGPPISISTADGLVADTEYYFVMYSTNGAACPSIASNEVAAGLAQATLTDWVARVVAAGGATPSATSQSASNNYLLDLKAAGIDTKLKIVNLFVPDSVIAFATPLMKSVGSFDTWDNPGTAWLIGDGGVTGWKNPSDKSLQTGMKPADFMTAATGFGFVYVSVGDQTTNQEEWGVDIADGLKDYRMAYQWSDHTSFTYCYGTGATDFVQGTVNGVNTIAGYMACSRTANNAMNLYFANSTTAHFSVASNVNVNAHTPVSTINIFVFATNDNGSLLNRSKKRLSAVGWGTGLTAAESLANYNAITKARIAMGGGTV